MQKRGRPQSKRKKKRASGLQAELESMAARGRANTEQVFRAIEKVLASQDFETIEEMNAFLSQAQASGGLDRAMNQPSSDPRERAQDLVYAAAEAPDDDRARELLRQALELDPDCVDALTMLADMESNTPGEMLAGLRKAVAAGERSLGPAFFQENKGFFWGMHVTRPYMRAREGLTRLLAFVGNEAEAIQHLEEMLELNPNDNQGLRYRLLGLYLLNGNVEGADRLFKTFEEDSAVFTWGHLLRCLIAEDFDGAALWLRKARRANRHMGDFLTGRKPIPRTLPDAYAPGSREEAIVCLDEQGRAWLRQPAALEWLKKHAR